MLLEKAEPFEASAAPDHYFVYFENKVPSFDMKKRQFLFPKCPDPVCIDRSDHFVEPETMLTDPVLELAYDYFVKGHALRFVKAQYVCGVVERLQKLFDDGGVEYDKSLIFDLRYQDKFSRWESLNYLSHMKWIVDPSRKKDFASLRDIITHSWGERLERFPHVIRPGCISTIQSLMVADYMHSLSRMRPDYDRELVRRFAHAGKTDAAHLQNQPCRFNVTVEFVPSQRRKRERHDVCYEVSLQFYASPNALTSPPYEPNLEDTDVEDNNMD